VKHKTREAWLRAVAILINKNILTPKLFKCMPLIKVKNTILEGSVIKKLSIDSIRFACAYMPNMRVSQVVVDNQIVGKSRAIGQCHYGYEAKAEGGKEEKFKTQIFISPTLDNPVQVAEVVLHELIHTMTKGHNHKGAFRWISEGCGLVFTPNGKGHTSANNDLKDKLGKIVKQAGKYPHEKWTPDKTYKKQTTRMFKLVSLGVMIEPTDGVGNNGYDPKPYVVRASRAVLGAGFPLDPDGKEMYLELSADQFSELCASGEWLDKEAHATYFIDSTIALPSGGRGITKACYDRVLDGKVTHFYMLNHPS